jgi:pimeloyl-ACP methyl ester carboxylesterase
MAFFTAEDGARLFYTDEGAGLPLLCLAGLTRTGADFDYLAPHLPAGVRLIRPDYRGRGQSDWTGAATYTIVQEATDALALLDHLGIDRAAVLGTSRGGLIAMYLAVAAPDRLRGICFNDIGPVIEPAGLARIKDYVGRNPAAKTHAEVAARMPAAMEGFANVPPARWLAEAQRLYEEKPDGLVNRYDPELRVAFLAAFDAPPVDLWPAFDACAGLPLALLRGENSDLLSAQTAEEMRRRRPDMIFAEAPDRGHIPFLDEAESLEAIHRWLGQMT